MPSLSNALARPLIRAALVALVLGFYFWTTLSEPLGSYVHADADGYYNLLTRGMTKGHLYLDTPVDPFLRTMAYPWDPVARGTHGAPDSSYYHGHYYIYFGVSPVLLAFLPFHALTGHYIEDTFIVAVFASIGFVASVLLLIALRERYAPQTPQWVEAACILALGLANMTPVTLRRASLWETPGSCGYACAMIGLLAVYQALHRRRAWPWMILAGLGFGFAVGSRPLYLLVSPVILIPPWLRLRGKAPEGSRPQALLEWAATLVPIAAVGIFLAAYNQMRFHSPFEFGLKYQIWNEDPAKTVRFAWRFFVYNVHAYLLAPAQWSHYFPFVDRVHLQPTPASFYGAEDPYGIVPNMPFFLLGFGCLSLLPRRADPSESPLRWIVAAIAVVALGMTGVMLFFQAALNRYMMDFVPALALLGAAGALLATRHLKHRRGLVAAGIVLLSAYSCLINVLAGFRHNELFKILRPQTYATIAAAANRLPDALDRLKGIPYGPLELRIVFPTDKSGLNEPIVTTGETFLSDYLFVNYQANNLVTFGLIHAGGYTDMGAPIHVEPGVPHTVKIDLPTLYPPAESPFFARMPPSQAHYIRQMSRVQVDGELALYLQKPLYDATSAKPLIGAAAGAFEKPFSGTVLSVRRLDPPFPPKPTGRLKLRVILAAFSQSEPEALLSLGQGPEAGLIFVSYPAPNAIQLGYVEASGRRLGGPRIDVVPGGEQSFDVSGTSEGAKPTLIVRVNGVPALRIPQAPSAGGSVVGTNPANLGGIGRLFSGSVREIVRTEPTAETETGAIRLHYKVPTFTSVGNEPLVCTGATGKGDLVYIRYLATDRILFGFDHWGVSGQESPPITIDPQKSLVIDIDFDALHAGPPGDARAELHGIWSVSVDGKIVVKTREASYRVDMASVAVATNPIGSSSAPGFATGTLSEVDRLPEK